MCFTCKTETKAWDNFWLCNAFVHVKQPELIPDPLCKGCEVL